MIHANYVFKLSIISFVLLKFLKILQCWKIVEVLGFALVWQLLILFLPKLLESIKNHNIVWH